MCDVLLCHSITINQHSVHAHVLHRCHAEYAIVILDSQLPSS